MKELNQKRLVEDRVKSVRTIVNLAPAMVLPNWSLRYLIEERKWSITHLTCTDVPRSWYTLHACTQSGFTNKKQKRVHLLNEVVIDGAGGSFGSSLIYGMAWCERANKIMKNKKELSIRHASKENIISPFLFSAHISHQWKALAIFLSGTS